MIFVHFFKKKKIFILKAAPKRFHSLYNILAQLWGMFDPEKVPWTLFNGSWKYFLKGEKENQWIKWTVTTEVTIEAETLECTIQETYFFALL